MNDEKYQEDLFTVMEMLAGSKDLDTENVIVVIINKDGKIKTIQNEANCSEVVIINKKEKVVVFA